MTLDEGSSALAPWFAEGIQQATNFETKNYKILQEMST